MRYRRLGASGLRVSEIGFGCGDTAGILVRAEPSTRRRAVERALELGINYFDTGPSYGKGISETRLGVTLRELGVRPIIATKVDLMPHQLDDIAGAVVSSCEESLRRLQVDVIDVLQVHNAPTFVRRPPGVHGFEQLWIEDYLRPGGALEGLERLRRQGKVLVVGCTAESADAEAVLRLIREPGFGALGLNYHLLNPSAGLPVPPGLRLPRDFRQLVDAAAALGVGVVTFSPLAMGALSDGALAGEPRHPTGGGPAYADSARFARDVARASRFAFLAHPGSRSLAQAATRFALEQPGISTVVGGFSAIEHLEEAVACSDAEPLSPSDLARMEMVWRANLEAPRVSDPPGGPQPVRTRQPTPRR
jgi:L-glyceraldehyde 3-phosphate reductase